MAEVIRPQKGAQEKFLSSKADIVIYGGAAGGGKTYALLIECLRHIDNPQFSATIFRKNSNQITANGGLWDTAMTLYPQIGGIPRKTPKYMFRFPSGAKITFAHLERYTDALGYQGSQLPLICCEESTLIRMADGTKKPLSEIQTGDLVETLHGPMPVTAIGNRRLEECVEIENEYGEKQVHSVTHKILTSSSWVSYSDMCTSSESRQPSICGSMVCCASGKHAEHCESKCREPQKPHDSRCSHQRQEEPLSPPTSPDRGLQEISSCMVPQGQESCCESSQLNNREPLQQLSGLHAPEHQRQVHESTEDIAFHAQDGDGWRDVLNEREVGGLRGHCLEDPSRCDGHVHPSEDNGPNAALILDGVVVRSRRDSLSDGQGKVRKNSLRTLQYTHPYTGEELTAEEADVEFHSCKITPCGKRWVMDLTVFSINHYITESGYVNKNCFDEATHFDESTFWYMVSRNRSTCGVKPYIRMTTNPMPDTFVAKLVDWWIDPDSGYAIPERSGVIRYFVRVDGELIWGDSREEVSLKTGMDIDEVKSFTFIASKLEDNKILMSIDKGYMANLKALPLVEQERLLKGNWKIRPAAGLYFKRTQIPNDGWLEKVPDDVTQWVRGWDLAATDETEDGDPAYTAGVLIGKRKSGRYVIADATNERLSAAKVREHIKNTAKMDKAKYKRVKIRLPKDPGQAGKEQAQSYLKMLAGFNVMVERETGSKESRAEPLAAQWQAGNVEIVLGPWTETLINQYESFPEGKFKDLVDAGAGAFNELERLNTSVSPPKTSNLLRKNYWGGV